ncbi:monovalent cation/H(+) antiporter subunit G [Bacillus marasmi]|uniref:monovalent cation/H(+) antiporter subunit G n=1 Tax=Bacillus marasmi TaxID=1926279 RepID=UPI0011CC5E9C|nr:monovalent cation/H(+) antiporter subunit G [Bacillus marasmi]
MTEISHSIIILFIIIGAFLNLAAAYGVVRLPDVYTRNHAASKATTLGVVFLLLATFLFFYIEMNLFQSRLILTIVFIFLTSPVSGHLINRAAYNSGVKLWDKSVRDDLDVTKKEAGT